MVRIGDRVHHFLDIKNIGTVINILFEGSEMHLEGGTSQQRIVLIVKLDNGQTVKVDRNDVLKAE